jgi:predicted amidophosphoribosyltransferase
VCSAISIGRCRVQINPKITTKRIVDACERHRKSLDNPGFCVACGADAEGVEPDARRYTCEACGKKAVYGAEELLMLTTWEA